MSAAYGAPAHGCWIGASRARTVAGHDHSPYRNHSDRPPRYLAVLSPPQLMQDFLVEAEGSLAAFVWRYEPDRAKGPSRASTTAESIAMAKELKQRGWRFVGPTTVYAFMQAMGLVNDHYAHCDCRRTCEAERKKLKRPSKAVAT